MLPAGHLAPWWRSADVQQAAGPQGRGRNADDAGHPARGAQEDGEQVGILSAQQVFHLSDLRGEVGRRQVCRYYVNIAGHLRSM